MIEHVAVLVEPDQDIQPAEFLRTMTPASPPAIAPAAAGQRRALPRRQGTSRGALREGILRPAGVPCRGNMSKAARPGVTGPRLYRLMDKHHIPRDERGGDAGERIAREESVLRRLLDEAALHVMDDWHVVRQDAASREDVVKTLGALTNALKVVLDGGAEDVQELATLQRPGGCSASCAAA